MMSFSGNNRIMMMIPRFLILGLFVVIAFGCYSVPVFAVDRLVAEAEQEAAQDESDDIIAPVRRIFSADLKNEVETRKLDVLYRDIETTLWDLAQADQIHQKGLMSLMEAMKFKYSRRLSEFKAPMDKAMEDLNKNRRVFKEFVKKQNNAFLAMKVSFQEEEAKAEKMWNERIAEFEVYAEQYFRSQKRYLDLYNGLVRFIMERAGGYYYESTRRRVMFYKVEEYTFFAENLDFLNKLSFKQKESLEAIRPPEVITP
jgi:general stress protein 26